MATTKKLDRAVQELNSALSQIYNDTSSIERTGNKIIIPPGMSLPDAAKTIADFHVKQEEVIETVHDFQCNPADGIVSFHHTVTEVFGQLMENALENTFPDPLLESTMAKSGKADTSGA